MKMGYLVIGLVIIFSLVLLPQYDTQTVYTVLAQEQQLASINTTLVGAGGNDALWDDFVPQNINIDVGSSVT